MPYVGTKRVEALTYGMTQPEKYGDLCALAFRPMVQQWLENPSWTTWSEIRKSVRTREWSRRYVENLLPLSGLFSRDDAQDQTEAAAQVFYDRYVRDYEEKKFRENGGIIDKNN